MQAVASRLPIVLITSQRALLIAHCSSWDHCGSSGRFSHKKIPYRINGTGLKIHSQHEADRESEPCLAASYGLLPVGNGQAAAGFSGAAAGIAGALATEGA